MVGTLYRPPRQRLTGAVDTKTVRSSKGMRAVLVAFVVYGAFALAANWPMWPGDPSRFRTFAYGALGGGDLYQTAWFLAWIPDSLLHLTNPFYTATLNYPGGINLAQNTLSPLLGLIFSPLTLAVSPISSVNLAVWLAFPLSATAMFAVLRRWVSWQPAAFVGGVLYAFSPYMVTQGMYHLDLVFVPLPPLIFNAMYEVIRSGQPRTLRWGTWLGLLLAAQFFISPEVCATTLLVAAVGALILAVSRRRAVAAAIERGITGVYLASLIFATFVLYPFWVMVAGPYRYTGPAYPGTAADLFSTLLPTSMQRLTFASWAAEGNKLLMGNTTENGVYLGAPLLLLLLIVVLRYRRLRRVRFAALMVVATVVLSWGPNLVVLDHVTAIPLPFKLLVHLPFADNILTARLSLYTDMFAAALIAIGLDGIRHTRVADQGLVPDRQRPAFRTLARGATGVIVALTIASLLPRWPYPTANAGVPRYFVTQAASHIPNGSVVFISPYPSIYDDEPQLWQAEDAVRFDLVGGYGLFRGPGGSSDNFPESLTPSDVESYLWNATYGGTLPQMGTQLYCDTRTFLLGNDVGTVIVSKIPPASVSQPKDVELLFQTVLGRPSTIDGQMIVWYDVKTRLTIQGPGSSTCVSG